MERNEKFYLYSQIWKELLVDDLSETAAQILRSHGNFFINCEDSFINLNFKGFNDVIFAIIQSIVQGINDCSFENKKPHFEKIQGALNLENERFLNSDPWAISESFFQNIILKNSSFDKKSLVEAGKTINFQEFLEFSHCFFVKGKYEG